MLLGKIRRFVKERGIENENAVRLHGVVSYEEYLKEKGAEDAPEERVRYSKFLFGIYSYLLQVIKERLGEERYEEAIKKSGEFKKHLFEVVHVLGYLSYREQVELVVESLRWLFKDELLVVEVGKLKLVEGRFYYEGEEVELRWIPSLLAENGKKQAIVSYGDYVALLRGETLASRDVDLPFTFRDVIRDAYLRGASDVHVVYDADGFYHVLFRIEGVLVEEKRYLLSREQGEKFVKSIKIEASQYTKGKVFVDDPRKLWDGRIECEGIYGTERVDVRLVFIPDGLLQNQEVVGRLLRRQKVQGKTLWELGYYPEDAEVMERASRRLGGLFLISGITNSGKSTTLATLVAGLPQDKKIETIEDPIEYVLPSPNVCQHQVYEPLSEEEKVSFNEYIKGFKRGDPDVIVVSEIRKNPELVSALIEGARAGQTIFSTVHINSAFEIYKAFKDLFGIGKETTLSLILFSVNQMLIPKLCECKVLDEKGEGKRVLRRMKEEIPFAVLDPLEKFLSEDPPIYRRGGCERCGGTGYSGRTLVYEYFYPTVKFIDWLSGIEREPSRYEVERKVYELGIGKNRLEIFLRRLKEGIIDVSERTLRAIII